MGKWKTWGDGEKIPYSDATSYEDVNHWVDYRDYADTTHTSGWGMDEAGRIWWNTTLLCYQYWNGTEVKTVPGVAGAATYQLTPSYTVYKSGSTYYAMDTDGDVTSDSDAVTLIESLFTAGTVDPSSSYATPVSILIKSGWYEQASSLTIPDGAWTIWSDGFAVFYQASGAAASFVDWNLTNGCHTTLRNLMFRRHRSCTGNRHGILYTQGANLLFRFDMDNVWLAGHQYNADYNTLSAYASSTPAGDGIRMYEWSGSMKHANQWRNIHICGFDVGARLNAEHMHWNGGYIGDTNTAGLWLSPDTLGNCLIENLQGFHIGNYFVVSDVTGLGESAPTQMKHEHKWLLRNVWAESETTGAQQTAGWNAWTAWLDLQEGGQIWLEACSHDFDNLRTKTFLTTANMAAAPNDKAVLVVDAHTHFDPQVCTWTSYGTAHVHESRFIMRIPSGTTFAQGDNAQNMKHSYLNALHNNDGGRVFVFCSPLTFPTADVAAGETVQVWGEDYSETTTEMLRMHVYSSAAIGGAGLTANWDVFVKLESGLSP